LQAGKGDEVEEKNEDVEAATAQQQLHKQQ
jgi:hypothetical protein